MTEIKPRTFIVGNCHMFQMATSLELMTEETVGTLRDPLRCKHDAALRETTCTEMSHAEKIGVMSTFAKDFISIFPKFEDKVVLIPHVTCGAYHPDIVEFSIDRKRIESRMEMSHSKLILFGYIKGFDEARTRTLFTEDAYRTLGYFAEWDRSMAWAKLQSDMTGWDVENLYRKWRNTGCFVYNPNHPKLSVLSDLSAGFAERAKLPIFFSDARDMQIDKAAAHAIWPVYPEIAAQFGISGSLRFKLSSRAQNIWENRSMTLSLEEFIADSYARYAEIGLKNLPTRIFQTPEFEKVLNHFERKTTSRLNQNPYKSIANHQFWKRSIANTPMAEVDPVVEGKFKLTKTDRVATAGSCFAQHISNTLALSGCNYFVSEQAPAGMPTPEAKERNYGTFSARFGNVYNTRQLLQLFDRAYGNFEPIDDHLVDDNGRFLDPWRPLVEPGGFETLEALHNDRANHLTAVRAMFEELDVLVFTLGLTEGWQSRADGSVFPVVPGALTSNVDADDYEFFNMTAAEVTDDLKTLHRKLKSVNPRARTILTVSPVPLIATYENTHVLAATTYSKSVLRVAAEHLSRAQPDVMYFPSYEIITGTFNRGAYFEKDLRSVKQEGVDHVMRLFMKHCVEQSGLIDLKHEIEKARIVCDEEILD